MEKKNCDVFSPLAYPGEQIKRICGTENFIENLSFEKKLWYNNKYKKDLFVQSIFYTYFLNLLIKKRRGQMPTDKFKIVSKF